MPPSTYYTISLPKATERHASWLSRVYPHSSQHERECVERFARYFLREMHTGGIQFEAAETTSSPGYVPYEAYLFKHEDRYIGACCFRKRNPSSSPTGYELDWAWLHPYFRMRGKFSEAFEIFRVTYGNFSLAQPLSPAMLAVARKYGVRYAA
jgi:hypothetical protein